MTPTQLSFIRACVDYLSLPDTPVDQCYFRGDNQQRFVGADFIATLIDADNFVVTFTTNGTDARITGEIMFRHVLNEIANQFLTGSDDDQEKT